MHVVSGTPGRVFDMIKRRSLRTRQIKVLVLDEADEMLGKGFKEQIYDVYRYLPPDTQVGVGPLPPWHVSRTEAAADDQIAALAAEPGISLLLAASCKHNSTNALNPTP